VIIGHVVGHATSTVKHRSFVGHRLILVQPHRAANNDPCLAFDELGCRVGDVVIASSDGLYTRELVKDNQSPARWTVIGIIDSPKGVLVE
jgi:ethanolamine utilization protein EutN